MLPTVQNEVFWIDFVSIRRNDCCITSIPTPKFEVWQESADSWETKIKRQTSIRGTAATEHRFNHCQHYLKVNDFSFSHS